MFQIRRMFFESVNIHKVVIKVRHSLVIKIGRAIATSFIFKLSHGSEMRFLRNGEKCYIYFVVIHRCFQQLIKLLQKRSTPRFLNTVYIV